MRTTVTVNFRGRDAVAEGYAPGVEVRRIPSGEKLSVGGEERPHEKHDVYHNGVHLGHVENYVARSQRVEGKNRSQPSKERVAWATNPKQVGGYGVQAFGAWSYG
jgi:hypothetical protein